MVPLMTPDGPSLLCPRCHQPIHLGLVRISAFDCPKCAGSISPRRGYRLTVFVVSTFLSAFVPYEIGSKLGLSAFYILLARVVCIVPFGGIISIVAITVLPPDLVEASNHRSAIPLINPRNVAAATCRECCVNCFSPHTRSMVHGTRTGVPFFLAGENCQLRTNDAASLPHVGSVAS